MYTDGLLEPGCVEGCAALKAADIFGKVEYSQDYHRRLMETALSDSGRPDFDDDVTLVTARIL
jgi:hypothetical protein